MSIGNFQVGKKIFKTLASNFERIVNRGNISKNNRDGEKFICVECGHIDHADTQASRTILGGANLKFVSTRRKTYERTARKLRLSDTILPVKTNGIGAATVHLRLSLKNGY